MPSNSIVGSAASTVQPIALSEWLRLRRHPRPEFSNSLDGVPHSLLNVARPALPPDRAVQGALVLPGEYFARKKVHWEWVSERALIFLDGSALYVMGATAEDPPRVTLIDAKTLLYVRSSLILLYGLIEMEADCGAPEGEVRLEYNTVIWDALRGPLSRFVDAACRAPARASEEEARARNAPSIRSLPFKFANGVRYYGLVPGELLLAAVFQKAIWERRGILPKEITPNMLLALTDRKVVLIEETRSFGWLRRRPESEYGWIFTYIPRNRVAEMTVTKDMRWMALTMRLEWGAARNERTFLLEPSIAAKWEEVWRTAQEV